MVNFRRRGKTDYRFCNGASMGRDSTGGSGQGQRAGWMGGWINDKQDYILFGRFNFGLTI